LFRLPATIVEPMIAASIVVVAIQNVFWPKRSQGRSRLLVAFVFGLFHGLGFAGGLLDAMTDMQASGAAAAIAAFSVGVEIGHQLVVAPAYCAMRVLHRAQLAKTRPECFVKRYGSALISVAGMIYLVAALREASP
ncbi:MAG TPA: HupE/UreJ family protein, partial [Candidatus Bathyarchaeia archaeon]|nr:HupE/UreJ family protein [Candidatus Bathyarchaeia archaeon]